MLKQFVLGLAFVLALNHPAAAFYSTNYAAWSLLSESEKLAYTAGLADVWQYPIMLDSDFRQKLADEFRDCVTAKQLMPEVFMHQIDAFYEVNSAKRDMSPSEVFVLLFLNVNSSICDLK